MNSNEKCHACVEMLKQVLTSASSRPRTLLEAMGSSCDFSSVKNGVVVSMERETTPAAAAAATTITPSISMTTTLTQQPLAASSAIRTQSLKIECRPCGTTGPEGGARAFVMGPSPLSIVLCSNRLGLHSPEEMEQVLVHELIHVYDVIQLKLDLRSCVNLAYSEIRAARDAECHDSWFPQSCIQKKAMTATLNLFPQQGGSCISQVYNEAMADRRPFVATMTTTTTNSRPSER
jgi:Peptidase M76 family